MQELIQKLEKATEGSEELDALIVAELNDAIVKRYPPTEDFGPKNRWQFWSRDGKHFLGSENGKRFHIAPLTRSLDAALSLVPEGMEWESTNLYGIARAGVGINADDGPFYGTSEFGSVPVALCIAALRARHSQPSDDKASDLANGAETA